MIMPCTTILVGKKASYDGSTMIARNDDSPSGQFTPKKFVVVHPEEQPSVTTDHLREHFGEDQAVLPCYRYGRGW